MVIFHSYVKVYQMVDVRDSGTSGEITQFGWNLTGSNSLDAEQPLWYETKKIRVQAVRIIAHSPERCSQKLRSTLG